jgi:ParB/RepB/Spo0J family partition protein
MTSIIARPSLQEIPLRFLIESEHNPRTRFDPTELAEMAESLRQSGQLNAILVRPHPEKPGCFEIAAGACRRRAAELAGLSHLTAVVRELDDATFVEFVNVENRQRNNLEALDEARGFADWMKTAGLKIPDIAARIGLSEKYVYDRLKLLQLIKPAQKLLADRIITAGHAILLARLSKADQERAIGDTDGRWGKVEGLFTTDYGRTDAELELADDGPRKPVSVREFSKWIDDHVRFVPEREDLPNLFPETAVALAAAKDEKSKVVMITRDYRVQNDAKDEKHRTYGNASWQRADGDSYEDEGTGKWMQSKPCEYSVIGVVAAGPGRGEAFPVCVNKDKCAVHWGTEKRQRAKAATQRTSPDPKAREKQAATDAREAAKRKEAERESARWKKAIPALRDAAIAALKSAAAGPTSPAAVLVLHVIQLSFRRKSGNLKLADFGTGPESVIRLAALRALEEDALDEWRAEHTAPEMLKPFGIDAQSIVDQAVPKEKPAPAKVQTSAKKNGKKKLAGDVRRAEAKKKAKTSR